MVATVISREPPGDRFCRFWIHVTEAATESVIYWNLRATASDVGTNKHKLHIATKAGS